MDEKLQMGQETPKLDCVEEAPVADAINTETLYDATEVKKILRKIDWRVLPMLTLLYILSFIDRSNSKSQVAVARHMSGLRF